MSDKVVSFPGAREPTEQEALAGILAAFDGLPDAFKVTLANLLIDRVPPAYGRAAAAMLAERYPQPKSLDWE